MSSESLSGSLSVKPLLSISRQEKLPPSPEHVNQAWEKHFQSLTIPHSDFMPSQILAANSASSQTYHHAQVLGQGDPMAQDMLLNSSENKTGRAAAEEQKNNATLAFLTFVNMSFEERMLFQILGEEGMTKEEFEALSPEDQEKIMAKVRERLALKTQPDGTAPVKEPAQDLYNFS